MMTTTLSCNKKFVLLSKYGTRMGDNPGVKDLIVPERIVEQMSIVLFSRGHNNVALVGPAGTGKTSTVQAFARDNPSTPVYELKLNVLIKDFPELGKLGKKLEDIFSEAAENSVVLFIDEGHRLCNSSNSNSLANILKPFLTDERVRVIIATTDNEFKEFIADDVAMVRRFTQVKISEPMKEEVCEILKLRAKNNYAGLKFSGAVLEHIATASSIFADVLKSNEPDRSLTLLDFAASYLNSSKQTTATKEAVNYVLKVMYKLIDLTALTEKLDKSFPGKLASLFGLSSEKAKDIFESLIKKRPLAFRRQLRKDNERFEKFMTVCIYASGYYSKLERTFALHKDEKLTEEISKSKHKAVVITIPANVSLDEWESSDLCRLLLRNTPKDRKAVPTFLVFEEPDRSKSKAVGFMAERGLEREEFELAI